jgi:hypothetical protein
MLLYQQLNACRNTLILTCYEVQSNRKINCVKVNFLISIKDIVSPGEQIKTNFS